MPLAQIVLVVVAFGLTIATLIYKYRVGKKRKVDDAPEGRIASVLFAFSLASALLGGALSIISLKLPEPMILPCDGMLTEEHPAIELRDLGGAAAFVATDSYDEPRLIGKEYTGPFVPESECDYHFQSVLLWLHSGIMTQHFTPASVSAERLGRQEGGPSEGAAEPEESSTVSQSKTEEGGKLPSSIRCGWGDSGGGRKSVTLDEVNAGVLDRRIVFNSISDSVIGDERNFVAARLDDGDHGAGNRWNANVLEVEPGNTYLVRLYGHNNNPLGYGAIAKGVKAQFIVPAGAGRSVVVNGLLWSENADPQKYWDGVVLTSDRRFHLEVVEGSPLIESNGAVGSRPLPMDVVNGWTLVGYDALDGSIPGCYRYAFYLTLRVRVVAEA